MVYIVSMHARQSPTQRSYLNEPIDYGQGQRQHLWHCSCSEIKEAFLN